MSEENIKIDRDYTDIFSIKDMTINKIMPMFFSEETSNLTTGELGVVSELIGTVTEDSYNTSSVLLMETFPNRAKLSSSIRSNAAIFQLSNLFASAATCTFLILLSEDDVIANSVSKNSYDSFYIGKNTVIYVEDKPFSLDYDIEIRSTIRNGKRVFTAKYIMNTINTNSVSKQIDPYIRMRKSSNGVLALQVLMSQYTRSETYESIIDNSKLNYPTIKVGYADKIAGFDVFYKAPGDSDYNTKLETKVEYSLPSKTPFCYYSSDEEGQITLSFTTKDGYFQPKFNSELKIIVYNTLGSTGNFDLYKGENVSISKDKNYEYNRSWVITAKPVTASKNGKDPLDDEGLQALTVEGFSTATVLSTEQDLQTYFNNYKYRYDNEVLFVKKRDDAVERLFSAFMFIKRDDYFFPTNTLNLHTNLNTIPKVSENTYVINPGYLFTYEGDSTKQCTFIEDTSNDYGYEEEYETTNQIIGYYIKNDDTSSYDGFYILNDQVYVKVEDSDIADGDKIVVPDDTPDEDYDSDIMYRKSEILPYIPDIEIDNYVRIISVMEYYNIGGFRDSEKDTTNINEIYDNPDKYIERRLDYIDWVMVTSKYLEMYNRYLLSLGEEEDTYEKYKEWKYDEKNTITEGLYEEYLVYQTKYATVRYIRATYVDSSSKLVVSDDTPDYDFNNSTMCRKMDVLPFISDIHVGEYVKDVSTRMSYEEWLNEQLMVGDDRYKHEKLTLYNLKELTGMTIDEFAKMYKDEHKFLYTNPFMINIIKQPNHIGYYLTDINQDSLLDFVRQNDSDSFIQFITYTLSVSRDLSADKKYKFSMDIIPSITASTEDNDDISYADVIYDINDNRQFPFSEKPGELPHDYNDRSLCNFDKSLLSKNNLRVVLAVVEDGQEIAYMELIPTQYNKSGQILRYEGEFFTDDYITNTYKFRNTHKCPYCGHIINNSVNDDDEELRYVCSGTGGCGRRYQEGFINVKTVDDLLFDIEGCDIRIYTLFRDPTKETPVTDNHFVTFDKTYTDYIWTNIYETITDPITFIKPLNMLTSNIYYEDWYNTGGLPCDCMIYSLPLIKYSILAYKDTGMEITDKELVNDIGQFSYFMKGFMDNYDVLEDERLKLKNASNIDIKFYNTYGKSTNFTIGDDAEIIDTINIRIAFKVWLTLGTDKQNAMTELRKFIKDTIESINTDGTNNLYISNLMRKIEDTFAYVDHIKFEGINDYSTNYQTVKNTAIKLTDLTKEERRYYVPDLLVINNNEDTIKLDIKENT